MSTLTPDRVPEGWDATADAYDRVALPFTSKYAADALRLARVEPGERVLDVAAGSGALTVLAARAGARVLATDFAPGMVARLRARLDSEKLAGVEARLMDGQALDLPDSSFDAAFSIFGLIFFPDRLAGFREMRRVLRPGGRAVVATWSRPERAPCLSLPGRAARELGIPLAQPPGGPAVFSLQEPRQIETEMLAAGFRDVRIETVTHTWDFATPGAYWDDTAGVSPVFGSVLAQLGERRDAVRARVADIVRREHGAGPSRVPGEAHLALARVP